MEAAIASSLLQQQELYSSIHSMTGSFMQQKGTDLTALQVGSKLCLADAHSQAERCTVVDIFTRMLLLLGMVGSVWWPVAVNMPICS